MIILKADANFNELNDLEKKTIDNISIKIVSKEEAIKTVSKKTTLHDFPDLSFSIY